MDDKNIIEYFTLQLDAMPKNDLDILSRIFNSHLFMYLWADIQIVLLSKL